MLIPESSPFFRAKTTIAAGGTETLYSHPLDKFHSAKIIVSAYNVAQDKTKILETLIIKNSGALDVSVGGIVTNGLSMALKPVINGANFDLDIENKNGFSMIVECVKTIFGPTV